MSTAFVPRDYSLVGPEAEKAVASGLASAKWYAPQVARAELKALMQRRDGPAIRDTLIWFAALLVSGGLGVWFWGSWAAVPFFVVYGVLYGSASDSRWHECGHRTAFKTHVDERRGLRDRLLHGHARAGSLALEPHPPPHRHDHRRPRSRSRPAAARPHRAPPQHFRAEEQRGLCPQALSACGRPGRRAGGNLHTCKREAEGHSQGARLSRYLRGGRSPPALRRAQSCPPC